MQAGKRTNKKVTILKILLLFGILISFSTCKGLIKSDESITSTQSKIKLEDKILLIFQDSKNNMWFGGNEKGVYRYNSKNLELFTKKDGLIAENIIGIQEDASGNLYFETPQGVSVFDGKNFNTIKIIENNISENVWKLEPDDLWFKIGGDSDGPYRFDGKYLYHLKFPKTIVGDNFHKQYPNSSYEPYSVYKIYKDKQGNIWFGTSSVGLFRFDGKSINWLYEEQLQKTPSGGDFGMRSIINDKDGYFWFNNSHYRYQILQNAENGKLSYKRFLGIAKTKKQNKTEVPYFLSIAEDKIGNLWMATYHDGVWRNDGKELVHFPVKNGEKNILLFSVYVDNQGGIWLGTHNDGVYKYNGKEFIKFEP
jgi:ligand-binding sensor domain-containing protein